MNERHWCERNVNGAWVEYHIRPDGLRWSWWLGEHPWRYGSAWIRIGWPP